MYVNKCTKCGAEFETKNPKRIICPNCLYPDRKPILDNGDTPSNEQNSDEKPQQRSSYSYEGNQDNERPYPQRSYNSQRPTYNKPQGDYQNRQYAPRQNYNRPQGGNYNNNRPQGSYNRPQGGYNRPQGGYSRPQGQGNYNRDGYNNRPPRNNYNNGAPRQGGFNRPQQRRPGSAPRVHRELLVTREQLAQIEVLYKRMLPLPNPDAHEVIGAEIGLEARKVFFGINLIRQKMFLPKVPFPKRKLAVSADQLTAIRNLYEPLLPIPPIGCHKIIAAQLKMDEWRVHVGIGLVRKQMGLDRWNEGRPDAPPQIERPRKGMTPFSEGAKSEKPAEAETKQEDAVEAAVADTEEKVKKTVKKKKAESETEITDEAKEQE